MLWRCVCLCLFVVVWVAAVYASLTYFGTRPSDRAQIWLACADRYSHLKKKKFDPPHPGGWLCGWQLYTVHLLISGHDRRTEPKFGSHVRIDTLTLKKITNLTHPTGGGLGGYLLLKIFRDRTRPNLARMCG